MKQNILVLVIFLLCSIFIITACTPTTSDITLLEGNAAEVDNEDARMEALISDKIVNCHILSFILS